MDEKQILEAIKKLRANNKERKFSQTLDLIINLKNFDARKESLNLFVQVPYKIKDKKIAGFLEKKSNLIHSITKEHFGDFKEKNDARKLKNYDIFVANAKLMPAVASSFGRVLGPTGKMPSPQLGVLPNEDEKTIKALIDKINSTVRVRAKEPSIKLAIAIESMKDDEIAKNILTVYQKILENLPKKIDNIKNVMIKFSMNKPVRIE